MLLCNLLLVGNCFASVTILYKRLCHTNHLVQNICGFSPTFTTSQMARDSRARSRGRSRDRNAKDDYYSDEDEFSAPQPDTHIAQISNISPLATKDQIYQLLAHLGRIETLKVCSLIYVSHVIADVSDRIECQFCEIHTEIGVCAIC